MTLRQNQVNAISLSVKNNFKSGIHFHATGSGKSWIALELILKYYEKYPKKILFGYANKKVFLLNNLIKVQSKKKAITKYSKII